jgi:hypothetical protein
MHRIPNRSHTRLRGFLPAVTVACSTAWSQPQVDAPTIAVHDPRYPGRALDDLRRLGEADLALNHPEARRARR